MKTGFIRKMICAAAAACIMLGCLFTAGDAEAKTKSFEQDGYTFLLTDSENRLLTIAKAPASIGEGNTIPGEIVHRKKTYHITAIANSAFAFTDITDAVIPDTVTEIGSSVFAGCSELKHVYIPAGLKSIGTGVFSYCPGLTSVEISEENGSFVYTDGILFSKDKKDLIWASPAVKAGIEIPEETENILAYAFEGNATVKKVKLPSTLKTIGAGAFMDCASLKSVTIPKNVNKIEGNPFMYCTALEKISVESGNKNYCVTKTGLLLNKKKTTLVSASAAKGDLEIPSGIKKIVTGAAAGNTSISSVTFDKELKTVGAFAFADCSSLKKVTFVKRKAVLSADGEVFKNTAYYLDVTVPYGSDADKENSIENLIRKNSPNGVIIITR